MTQLFGFCRGSLSPIEVYLRFLFVETFGERARTKFITARILSVRYRTLLVLTSMLVQPTLTLAPDVQVLPGVQGNMHNLTESRGRDSNDMVAIKGCNVE